MDIVEGLQERGIGFHALRDNIDTTQPIGKFVFHMLGALAEFGRVMISERTRAGMRAARDRGKPIGRPKVLSARQIERARWLVDVEHKPLTEIAARLHVGRATLRRALNAT